MAYSKIANLKFAATGDKKVNIAIKNISEDVEDSDIKALMNHIVDKNLVAGRYGALTGVVSAEVITRTSEEIKVS